MTAAQLVEKLSKLNPDAEVFTAVLLRDRVSFAKLPIVATAEKDGEILLCDPEVAKAILTSKDGN
jgi:hypothetical protein